MYLPGNVLIFIVEFLTTSISYSFQFLNLAISTFFIFLELMFIAFFYRFITYFC